MLFAQHPYPRLDRGIFRGRRLLRAGRGSDAGPRRLTMDFEKYTERARGFIQSAQSLALREGHQRFTPDHLLKVLLDDDQGLAAGLISAAGGNPKAALAAAEAALKRMPKVEGSGAGQLYMAPRDGPHLRDRQQARPEGRRQLRHRRAVAAGTGGRAVGGAEGAEGGRRHAAGAGAGDRRAAQGTHRRQRIGRRRAMTRSRNMPATSPRRRGPASSTRSSGATRKSGGPSRSCRAAPRTTRC